MPSDINSVLSSNTYYPFMNIYAYAVGSNSGASAMVSHLMDLPRSIASISVPVSLDGYIIDHLLDGILIRVKLTTTRRTD